jgi:hypothetical protein
VLSPLELGFISLNFPALTVWINHQLFLVHLDLPRRFSCGAIAYFVCELVAQGETRAG